MISTEENELLTRVGQDTPMGELLRRYWHPIGGASELTGKKFTKMVRLLGEDLVLYKDRSGAYDETGACIEQPYEEEVDAEARFKDKIHMTAYPVQELGGLLWTYLGPQP